MSHGSRVCPSCGALNAAEDPRCVRCGASAPTRAQKAASGLFDQPYLATRVLLGICLVNFALVSLDHGGLALGFLGPQLMASDVLRWGATYGDLAAHEPWRHLSAVYVHLGVLHLVMNSLALLVLGRRAEQRVGGARMILVFTLTGIIGFVVSLWWYGAGGPLTAGASGALFGLMGHEIGQMHARRDPHLKDILFQFLAYALAFALVFRVNNAAHVGGFLMGYPLGRALFLERRPWRHSWLVRGFAALSIGGAVGSVVLSASSDEWRARRAEEIQYGLR